VRGESVLTRVRASRQSFDAGARIALSREPRIVWGGRFHPVIMGGETLELISVSSCLINTQL